MTGAPVAIRELEDIVEFERAEQLQRLVWGFVDVEVVPLHLLVTAHHNGGLALGAFVPEETGDDALVGLVFGFQGGDDLGPKHCSHLLGVIPEARGQGLGPALKWAQRLHLLEAGTERVTWTYDPLMAANANLNLHRLGAVCRRYKPDLYGEIRDDLNRGLPTDRFEVDWWLRDERVARLASGAGPAIPPEQPAIATASRLSSAGFRVPDAWTDPGTSTLLVEVPTDLVALKEHDLELAKAWRDLTREAFTTLFARGCVARDFVRNSGRAFYVVARDAS